MLASKVQPLFVSILGTHVNGDAATILARSSTSLFQQSAASTSKCSLSKDRFSSSNSGSKNGSFPQQALASAQNAGSNEAPQSSLWSSMYRVLFPVNSHKSPSSASATDSTAALNHGTAATPAAASSSTQRTDASWKSTRPIPATSAGAAAASRSAREARAAHRRASRETEDAFAPLSKSAENFSGTLLKAAILIITLPLGLHMVMNSLMMSLCVRGLEADRPETVALTLRRVRSWVVNNYLASRFEEEDGVGLLLTTFNERSPEAVLREFLRAAQQLLQFKSTREALLMSSLVERLERASAAGWLPADLREPARQLYLDAHAARRMEMEAVLEEGDSGA